MHTLEKALLENWLKRCLSFKKLTSCYTRINKTLLPIICERRNKNRKNALGKNGDLNTRLKVSQQ